MFMDLLSRANQISEQTEGRFDVTMGALTKQWREIKKIKTLPDPDVLSDLRLSCGFQKVTVNQTKQTIEFPSGLLFDFGGIGKGYAADLALQAIQDAGWQSALVDLGGDIAIGAKPPEKTGWKVGVSTPSGKLPRYIELSNCGVATSGDTEQFVEIEGVRYSHVLDPATGLGVQRRAHVTVVSPNATLADAMASAYCVMSVQQAVADANESESADVLIQWRKDQQLMTDSSTAFPDLQQLK